LLPTTSATPPKPSASPAHCRAETRSPSSAPASAAVSSGCMPTTSAEMPAGRPRWIDMNTPPRYSACTSTPVTPICSASRGLAGQGARIASASRLIRAITST